MKIAYRIITPILALGAIAMGILLEMFHFVIGSADETVNNLVTAISNLLQNNGSNISTQQGFSVVQLIGLLGQVPEAEEGSKSVIEIIDPIFPQIVAFLVIMVIIVLVLLAIAVCSAAIGETKKRNRTVYGLSAAGIVLIFVSILITNNAFDHITGGDIDISALVSAVSDSALASLATMILTVTSATLSAGFYAIFGMFLLIIIWTIIAGYVIKSPIVPAKKAYKRKKPMRDPFAASKAQKAKEAKAEKETKEVKEAKATD